MITNSEIPVFPTNGENHTGMRQLLDMLRSLMPVLDNIKTAVENSSSKIPKATEQLSTVTQATESATMEILNLLDDIGRKVEHVQSEIDTFKKDLAERCAAVDRITAWVGTLPDEFRKQFEPYSGDWALLADCDKLHRTMDVTTGELAEIHSFSMNIAMALQVQDITSQQIESVRHQIESVRTQLAYVVGQYEGKVDEPMPGEPVKKAFDADAEYSKDVSRQADADDIIAQFTQQVH